MAAALPDALLGVYLLGSLAHGCFNRATSDIDIMVVTGAPLPDGAVQRLFAAHRRADLPLDLLVLTQSQLESDRTPAPVELLARPDGTVKRSVDVIDIPVSRQDAYECDVTLAGRACRDVISPAPRQALRAALRQLLPLILPLFKNPTLMLCRIAYAFETRSLCSKTAAGEWALGEFGGEWESLIRSALDAYASATPETGEDDDELRSFERHCVAYIAERDPHA
jgi:predicted nucleotidyltransferase